MKALTVTCYLGGGRQYIKAECFYYACPRIGKTAALAYFFEKIAVGHLEADIYILKDDDVTAPSDAIRRDFVKEFEDDPSLGVLCGNRYFTRTSTLPEAARHVWGVFAHPIMVALKIPCGAYMGIRRELIPDFLDFWRSSIFDDTKAARIAKDNGLDFDYDEGTSRLEENSTIGWRELWEFTVRQYIDVRCHGPWNYLLLVWGLTFLATVVAWSNIYAPPLIYTSLWLLAPIKKNLRTLLAIPIAQALFLFAIPIAGFKKSMKWKHHNYDLKEAVRKSQ